MLDASLFTTRNALTNYSIKFINSKTDYIAEEVFTPAVVEKSAQKKYQYDQSHLREVIDEASSKAPAQRVDYGVFTSNLTTKLHKLAQDIDPHDERNSDAAVADIEQDAAANIFERLMIRRERLAVTKAFTTSNYPAALTSTLGASATWASPAGDPEGDAKTAKLAVRAACGQTPNALAISYTTFLWLQQSPALKDRLKYTSGESITEQQIKNLLGVDYLHIGKAQYNSALESSADVTAEIWTDSALFYVKNPAQSLRTMSYGRFYVRNNLYSYTFLDEERGSGDGRIKVLEMGWDYVLEAGAVVSSADGDFTAGYCLANTY